MATSKQVNVKDLTIDLANFRTIPQQNEIEAIKAMITISPDYFWGLMSSLLDDGYLPTENIIILEDNGYLVKEGNRRIASLKIIHGYVDLNLFNLPDVIKNRISNVTSEWKKENETIPCTIYNKKDAVLVDKIVTLTHGKGQKAGRDDWETVARARHNKQVNGIQEYGLDLLEKYLETGENFTIEQKIRWSGKFNLTVLDEALPKIFPRVSCRSTADLVLKYPNVNYKKELDNVICAIGLGELTFPAIRSSTDFLLRYGIPAGTTSGSNNSSGSDNSSNSSAGTSSNSQTGTDASGSNNSTSNTSDGSTTNTGNDAQASAADSSGVKTPAKPSSTATYDVKTVRKLLRGLKLYGPNRSKLVDVRNEMLQLKLEKNPIAFVFLLRCMVELSAKAFCDDNASLTGIPKYLKTDGSERNLSDILRDIVSYLTQNKSDKNMVKRLHGPLTEIQRADGLLSITSMNQLVHNPKFIIRHSDIPGLFSNIFPLIEEVNK
ncbi:hypothetical protein [Yersinia pseudotuberculosis]